MTPSEPSGLIDQINALEPGLLRIYRDSEFDIGFREAIIYLDGKVVADVPFRKMVEIPVTPGEHTLQAYNRVFKSELLRLDVKPGERITLQTANVGGGCFTFFMLFQMGIPRIFLKREGAEGDRKARPANRQRGSAF